MSAYEELVCSKGSEVDHNQSVLTSSKFVDCQQSLSQSIGVHFVGFWVP